MPELLTHSDVLKLSLRGVDGDFYTLASLAGPTATVVVFTGNGCPTVRAYEERLKSLQATHHSDGVRLIAINSNNPYLSPPDTLNEMIKRAADREFNFPYLKDENGAVARSLGATCTPHAFVFDGQMNLVYEGRIDDSRIGGDRVSRRDLHDAVADVVAGRPVAISHTDPFGCSIVW